MHNADTTAASTPAPIDDMDLDLSQFRSQITSLRAESFDLSTDLLAMLGPLPRTVQYHEPDLQLVSLTRLPDDH